LAFYDAMALYGHESAEALVAELIWKEHRRLLTNRIWQERCRAEQSSKPPLNRQTVANDTEADGTREAAVTVAEGEKRAAILDAEGQRHASILRAEGFSEALENINGAAKDIDANTLSLQYFDTPKQLGASKATKFILPMEFTSLLRPFLGN
jgi:hypothetical protein